MRLALEGAFETAAAPTAPVRGSRLAWIAAATAAVVAAALAVPVVRHVREVPPAPRVILSTLLPPDDAKFDFSGPAALPAISPDGTRIVFGAMRDGKTLLWLRRFDSSVAQALPGTEDAGTPFWSPDGRWVAFGQADKLKKIAVEGGPPIKIADIAAPLRGGTWSGDGVILFAISSPGPVRRIAEAGGVPSEAIAVAKEGTSQRSPWFLPDGRHFLYTVSSAGDMSTFVASIDEPKSPGTIVAQVHSPAAFAQGQLLYLRENTLMAQPFDVRQLKTTGEAVPIAADVPSYTTPSRLPGFAVSPSGMLVYATSLTGGLAAQSRLVWKDRKGKSLGTIGDPTGFIGDVSLSPDGKRLAANIADPAPGKGEDLWIYDVARGIPTKFTFDPANERSPVWSPDGTTIYFSSNRSAATGLYRKSSDFAGTEQALFSDAMRKNPTGISHDGKLLVFQGSKEGPADVWVLPLAGAGGKSAASLFFQSPGPDLNGRFSLDDKWIAYDSVESGTRQTFVAPYPGPGGKRQISAAGGGMPRWRADGRELYFVMPDGQLMAAEVTIRPGMLEVGAVQKLFDGIVTTRGMTFDVSADGQKFLVVEDSSGPTPPLTLVQNWTQTLKK